MLFWGGQNELRNLCCHLPAGHLIWAIWWVFDLWNRDLDIVTRSRTQWGRVGGEWSLWVAWHPSPSRIPVCPLLISGLADPALSLSPVQVFDLVLMFMSSDLITFPWLLSGKIFWLLAFPWSQFHLEMLPSDTWGIWVIWSSPALRIQPWTWRWREAIQANYPQAELGVWGKRYRWGVAAIKVGQAELCWTSKYSPCFSKIHLETPTFCIFCYYLDASHTSRQISSHPCTSRPFCSSISGPEFSHEQGGSSRNYPTGLVLNGVIQEKWTQQAHNMCLSSSSPCFSHILQLPEIGP